MTNSVVLRDRGRCCATLSGDLAHRSESAQVHRPAADTPPVASLENSATAVTIPAFDAVVNAPRDMLIEESRRRPSSTLARREWAVSFASAGLFVGVGGVMGLVSEPRAAHLRA